MNIMYKHICMYKTNTCIYANIVVSASYALYNNNNSNHNNNKLI